MMKGKSLENCIRTSDMSLNALDSTKEICVMLCLVYRIAVLRQRRALHCLGLFDNCSTWINGSLATF